MVITGPRHLCSILTDPLTSHYSIPNLHYDPFFVSIGSGHRQLIAATRIAEHA